MAHGARPRMGVERDCMALTPELQAAAGALPKTMFYLAEARPSIHEECEGTGWLFTRSGVSRACAGCNGIGIMPSTRQVVSTQRWLIVVSSVGIHTGIAGHGGSINETKLYTTEAEALTALNAASGAKNGDK